jgi:hypothetical protein
MVDQVLAFDNAPAPVAANGDILLIAFLVVILILEDHPVFAQGLAADSARGGDMLIVALWVVLVPAELDILGTDCISAVVARAVGESRASQGKKYEEQEPQNSGQVC